MPPLFKVNNLVARLTGGANIVDGISFEIAEGKTFALLGESGCGKSMTALALMRLLPDGVENVAGSTELDGHALFDLREREMREIRGGKMAMIFQEPGLSLNPVMTVGEQINEVLALHLGVNSMDEQQRRVELLLDQVGIPDAPRRVREYPFQLSGGMKQRVMIAIALAGRPKLLIADEPTTSLDVTIQAQVLELLRETQKKTGMAILLITHDLGVVAETAHDVGVMYAGQIVERASREQLFSHPLHPYTQKLFAAMPDERRRGHLLSAIPGNVPSLGSVGHGCRFASRCDRALARCSEQSPEWTSLEDGHGVRCHLYQDVRVELEEGVSSPVVVTAAQAGVDNTLLISEAANLQISNLQVHFAIRSGLLQRKTGVVKAVDGVTLDIPQGRTLALVGESGCGKTTLGKAILQLIPPTGGSVRFAGRELIGLGAGELLAYRTAIQMVFQDPYASLNPKMRVAEILEEGMSALSVGDNSTSRQVQLDELLDKVGLDRAAKWRYPHEFSGGQRQRIAIARSLAVSPQLLVCDEPTSALDVSVQAQILNLLKLLQQEFNLSYLFITHNLAVVEYLAHEVCVMYLGRIVERGNVEEVLHAPKHPYTQALLSAVPRINRVGQQRIRLQGDLPSPANPPQGCHFAPRCTHANAQCTVAYPTSRKYSATHSVNCYLYE